MDKQRRKFLKIAGATALAGVSAPAVVKLSSTPAFASSGHGETAEHGAAAGHAKEAAASGTKRYGLLIDMRKLYDRPDLKQKAIDACNKAHNVPHITDKTNEIKWIWKTPFENAFPEHSSYHLAKKKKENDFLVTCNHCDSPPCVRVCPTKATFKMEENGIVAMDYHRCIGCRFCMMACPYGARNFNWMDPRPYIKEINPDFPTRMRGVVEKCNLCGERLALGKLPACVEALEDVGAIVFGDLNDPDSEIRKLLEENPTIQRKPSLGTHPSVFYIV